MSSIWRYWSWLVMCCGMIGLVLKHPALAESTINAQEQIAVIGDVIMFSAMFVAGFVGNVVLVSTEVNE